jgi:hypothetical protein
VSAAHAAAMPRAFFRLRSKGVKSNNSIYFLFLGTMKVRRGRY